MFFGSFFFNVDTDNTNSTDYSNIQLKICKHLVDLLSISTTKILHSSIPPLKKNAKQNF